MATDVTMLEMLILARARSHFAVVELSLDGRDTGRRSLASNTIIFPRPAADDTSRTGYDEGGRTRARRHEQDDGRRCRDRQR